MHRLAVAYAAILCGVAVGVSLKLGRRYPWHCRKSHRLRPSRNSDEEEAMKKLGFMTLLITATVLLTLAFSAAAGPKPAAAPVPAVAAVPAAPAPVATPEPHPHIEEALEHMRAAKKELLSAEHDFDGHRVKSVDHLNAAMHEAEICMGMK